MPRRMQSVSVLNTAGGILNTVMFDVKAGVLALSLTKCFPAEVNEIRNCFLFVSACVELHHVFPRLSSRLKLIEKPQSKS